MESVINYKLENFEGPLDLLLQLISKNKIDILDIPISELLNQYLEIINDSHNMDLNYASEFISMASYLILIKSKMLLPKALNDDEDDPRDELVKMLLQYQKYKEIAEIIKKIYSESKIIAVRSPEKLDFQEEPYSKSHNVLELLAAYDLIMRKVNHKLPPPVNSFKGIVGTNWTTISSRVVNLLRRVIKNKELSFIDAFSTATNKSDIVATFLAILSLMSTKQLYFNDNNNLLTIQEK